MRDTFVFYRTFKDTLDNIPDDKMRLELYEAIINYGLNGEYDQSNPIIVAFMQQIIFSIDRAQNNYENSIFNGSKGGAKRKFDYDEIKKLHAEGMNRKQIADQIGCSEKTVSRVINS